MSSPTDQQLIQFIGQGRRDALAQLFDRYSADLYDYLARLVGDRDQAARLLDTVFMRVPGAVPGFQPRESVRGGLYSLAREAGLDWLRQRGWLDGLPPSDEAIAPGLQGDVWKAARAMPAFFRAVLITEELHALSPSEKARALGVNRTDLPRLIDEARRSFNRIYDAQARGEGRPTSEQINPDTVWNARRRLPVEGGSLFGFLPLIPLPDSLRDQIRRHVVEAMSPPPAAAVTPTEHAEGKSAAVIAGAAAASMLDGGAAQAAPPQQPPPVVAKPQPQTPPPTYTETVTTTSTTGFMGLPTTAIAALIGVALALLICTGVFLLTQNRGKPSITSVQPANGATVTQAPQINVFAVFQSEREIDRAKSVLQIDGQNQTPTFVENTIAWSGPLSIGSHSAHVKITDTSSNSAEESWTFFVLAGGTGTPSPSPSAVASVTPIVPITPDLVTITPIILTSTPPIFVTATYPIPPTAIPGFTATPCTAGVAGVVFNDLNNNSVRDPNEPGLSNVTLTLLTQSNSFVSSTFSDTLGNYLFGNVSLGFYRVQAQTPAGWSPTSSTTLSVNLLGCGTISNFNFGFSQAPVATPTATFTPPTAFAVTNVSAFVSPPSSNSCPTTFSFNGTITTNGAGTVTYQWIRSDGTFGTIRTLSFAFAGTQNVASETWALNSNLSGWARVQVLSPNNLSSPQANFTLSCTPPTSTPTFTPTTPAFAVTNASAAVNPPFSSACPQTFNFTGSITTNGGGIVNYKWVRSDGSESPVQALTFFAAGTQNVAPDSWTLGAPGFNFNGWARIEVLAPNSLSSPQANFMLNCPAANTPTPTPTSTPAATFTPTPTTTPSFNVTGANANVTPASSTTCPETFTFNGDITVTGAGVVTYQWIQSDAVTGPVQTLTFLVPGMQSVAPHTWTIPGPGPFVFNGGAKIQVLTPNALDSPQANFTLNCP